MRRTTDRSAARVGITDKRQIILATLGTLWLVLLLVFHWQAPAAFAWHVAAAFSVAMNFVYIQAAIARRQYVTVEAFVAVALIVLSVMGAVVAPPFVIAAVIGHGLWDLAKHFGAGLPFFSWYTWGCFVVDVMYGSALFAYWVIGASG
ncbi:MAG: hypothetical protein AAF610_12670 [Pseudomonadota bacterium]